MSTNAIEWIKESSKEKHIKCYKYDEFIEMRRIGSGAYGEVFKAKLEHSEKYFALKSFNNKTNIEAVVREVQYVIKEVKRRFLTKLY